MPDVEKVTEALEECLGLGRCQACGYGAEKPVLSCRKLMTDILELLKEQEAVVPYQHDAVWLCGNCEKEVVGWDDDIDGKEYRYPFCRKCGQAVKWNERPV